MEKIIVQNISNWPVNLGGIYPLLNRSIAPTRQELSNVLNKIVLRITKFIEKCGIIKRIEEDHLQINFDEDDALARLQAGSATCRFTIGPNKGKKALILKTVPDTDHNSQRGLLACNSGF